MVKRHIHLHSRRIVGCVQRINIDMIDDAHNCRPILWFITPELQPLAKRVVIWPILFRKRLVDNDNKWTFFVVLLCEFASLQKPDSNSAKITGINHVHFRRRIVSISRVGTAFDPETALPVVSVQGNTRPYSGRFNARQILYPFYYLFKEIDLTS